MFAKSSLRVPNGLLITNIFVSVKCNSKVLTLFIGLICRLHGKPINFKQCHLLCQIPKRIYFFISLSDPNIDKNTERVIESPRSSGENFETRSKMCKSKVKRKLHAKRSLPGSLRTGCGMRGTE